MSNDSLPPWDEVLSAAARLQSLLPEAVLVGGTAAALYAGHRFSRDADHVLLDLRGRFDNILADLESVAGWRTARVNRPVLILGSLDGIETGIRQLIRDAPLETCEREVDGHSLRLPTEAEMLRIKAVLVLRRNATRDYVDLVALADHLGREATIEALRSFDRLYPQSGEGRQMPGSEPSDTGVKRLLRKLLGKGLYFSAVESLGVRPSPRLSPKRRREVEVYLVNRHPTSDRSPLSFISPSRLAELRNRGHFSPSLSQLYKPRVHS